MHALGNTISGVLAEYVVLDEQSLVRVPDYLRDEEASTLPCAALTAWYALAEKGQLHADQTVLIQAQAASPFLGYR
jgi:NADPH:quinone reductase-like Zn-dependent oxidoreductase